MLSNRIVAAIQPHIERAKTMLANGASTEEIVNDCGEWAARHVGIDPSSVTPRMPAICPPLRYRRRYGQELPRE